jgi:hypothetical protein
MGAMSTSLAAIAITAAAFIVQTDAAKAANPKIEFAAAPWCETEWRESSARRPRPSAPRTRLQK